MDLLGDNREDLHDEGKASETALRGFARGKEATLLLAGMPSSQAKCEEVVWRYPRIFDVIS
jgi:hypothetical protein